MSIQSAVERHRLAGERFKTIYTRVHSRKKTLAQKYPSFPVPRFFLAVLHSLCTHTMKRRPTAVLALLIFPGRQSRRQRGSEAERLGRRRRKPAASGEGLQETCWRLGRSPQVEEPAAMSSKDPELDDFLKRVDEVCASAAERFNRRCSPHLACETAEQLDARRFVRAAHRIRPALAFLISHALSLSPPPRWRTVRRRVRLGGAAAGDQHDLRSSERCAGS